MIPLLKISCCSFVSLVSIVFFVDVFNFYDCGDVFPGIADGSGNAGEVLVHVLVRGTGTLNGFNAEGFLVCNRILHLKGGIIHILCRNPVFSFVDCCYLFIGKDEIFRKSVSGDGICLVQLPGWDRVAQIHPDQVFRAQNGTFFNRFPIGDLCSGHRCCFIVLFRVSVCFNVCFCILVVIVDPG